MKTRYRYALAYSLHFFYVFIYIKREKNGWEMRGRTIDRGRETERGEREIEREREREDAFRHIVLL